MAIYSLIENFLIENEIYCRIFNFCVNWDVDNKNYLIKKMLDLIYNKHGNICFIYCKYTFLLDDYFKNFKVIDYDKPITNKTKLIKYFQKKNDDMINLIYSLSYDSGHFKIYYK